jgi:hypothetical protein
MNKIQELGLEEIQPTELTKISGGFWGAFFLGYVLGEVMEGVQRGLSKPCAEVKCC